MEVVKPHLIPCPMHHEIKQSIEQNMCYRIGANHTQARIETEITTGELILLGHKKHTSPGSKLVLVRIRTETKDYF